MISEKYQINTAIYPQTFSSNGTTGLYFNLKKFGMACFRWNVACTGLTATSTGLVYQATDKNGTGAAAITATSTVAYASSNMTIATITTGNAISAADTVTINGITFTALSANDTAYISSQTFCINTANVSTTATNMAAKMNDATYGIAPEGLYASASSTTLTIRFAEPGEALAGATYDGIWITSSVTTTVTVAGVSLGGTIEIDATKLTLSSNFTHVALNVINTAAYYASATVVRGDNARYSEADQIDPLTQVV